MGRRLRKGFTLIELLVVISVIGLLASIVMAALTSARAKSRDATRAEALHQMSTAVEMYGTTNGHYPYTCAAAGWTSFDSAAYSPNTLCTAANGAVSTGLTLSGTLAPYIVGIADPKNLGGDSGYLYINLSDANSYCLLIWRTPENMNNFPKSAWPPSRCSTIDGNGQCTSGGTNSIYLGVGGYVGGC